ncbi:cyclic dehypoxanthinyl futalosine synthase [Halalkalibacter hemicellulosilyticus]|uniref:Cyclic dehypoxanthine futalosine synthase n=1 Tax=Halalkalibacter hemicellulosilyticusJCM 9152 TaxID=1236971 RepID=W4QDK5_9BACI|nr:cyclic dehypoxanthinyl futalosine synthase [Halalkalibacter hemicellulosilyticus]GAE30135.1 menaquinone via futalosine step 3 [Halalkalibacter hemicellulosilyticusJCM 9152]
MSIDAILERAVNGERLSMEDAVALYESDEVEKMGEAANQVMLKWHPDPVATFVIGRNVNYTNFCDTYCRFCAFYRAPGHKEGYVLNNEEIFKKIEETLEVGGTEILMQGGTNPDLPLSYYTNLLKEIKERYNIWMHSFSPAEVWKIAEVSNMSVEDVLRELHEAGLDSMPGGGAEILTEETRLRVSRLKVTWEQWIEAMKATKRVGMHGTATMVIGFGESFEERALHLQRVRDAQDETECFTAFISWLLQPENTGMYKTKKLTPRDYLKNVAISRLFLDNIANFQSSWVTMGPEIGKMSLQYGCNDFGSTMMEENVVSAAGATHKVNTNLTLQLIREAGKIPAQRDTGYNILKVYHEDETADKDFVMQN